MSDICLPRLVFLGHTQVDIGVCLLAEGGRYYGIRSGVRQWAHLSS